MIVKFYVKAEKEEANFCQLDTSKDYASFSKKHLERFNFLPSLVLSDKTAEGKAKIEKLKKSDFLGYITFTS
jgi:hypothetical protein